MNIKIKNHINDHSNLINKNFNQIAYCIEKIAKDIKSTFKKKKLSFLQEMEAVQLTVSILQEN